MKLEKLHLAYFSPGKYTRKIVYNIAYTLSRGLANQQTNLTAVKGRSVEYHLGPNDIFLAALPTYSGRIPSVAPSLLRNYYGVGTPAVAVVTYGNRGYDNQLAEMQRVLEEQGFVVAAGAAFVCEHAMSQRVGTGRPDDADLMKARDFGSQVKDMLLSASAPIGISLPGEVPAEPAKAVPGSPSTLDNCVLCMQCYKWCPMDAIPWNDPMHTDASKCVMCQGCVRRCPVQARKVLDEGFQARVNEMEEKLAGQRCDSEVFL